MTALHVIARSGSDEAIPLLKKRGCLVQESGFYFASIFLVGLLFFFQQVTEDLGVVYLVIAQAQE